MSAPRPVFQMSRAPLRVAALALLSVLAASWAAAADVPTNDEWLPVKTAIEGKDPNAAELLKNLVAKFPKWPDGLRELGKWQIDHKDAEGCLANVQQALALNANDADAAALDIQALTQLGRGAEVFPIADRFTGSKDTKGWVNYRAAEAAFALGDAAKAEPYLKQAKDRAGQAIPADFHFLDGRIAERKNDLARAESSFARATNVNSQLWDGWYELGRVETALAAENPKKEGEYLGKAQIAFAKVTVALPRDYESWLGLGRSQLKQGMLALGQEQVDNGMRQIRDAAASLREAIALKDDLQGAHLSLGEALIEMEKYPDALVHLRRAQELGASDRALDFNLAKALEKTGHAAEAADLLKGHEAVSYGEMINKGVTAYSAKNYDLAIKLLSGSLAQPELEVKDQSSRELRQDVERNLGHAWRDWAQLSADKAEKAADADEKTKLLAERENQLDEAAKCYRQAAELGDRLAQRQFLFCESNLRSPERAYQAGWTFLAWNSYLAPAGWLVVVGNYGSSKAWNSPLHFAVWGAVGGLLLILWLVSFFARRTVRFDGERESQRASSKAPAKPAVPRASEIKAKVAARTGHDDALSPIGTPIRGKEKDALEPRGPAPKSKPPAKVKSDPAIPAAKKSDRRKSEVAETQPIEIPQPKRPR